MIDKKNKKDLCLFCIFYLLASYVFFSSIILIISLFFVSSVLIFLKILLALILNFIISVYIIFKIDYKYKFIK